ncbi:MAG: hypothetical protein B6I34_08395 [Anaerolineaceae bacterium 4572_32.1]|nr:MAG: hypothetical protein B6I34_08395 [Anaerolineaceae bacterium 4572_32.1]
MPPKSKHRIPWPPLIVLWIVMLLTLLVSRRETPPAPLRRFQVSAWMPYWDRPRAVASFAAHAADLDEINFFWYEAQSDGRLTAFSGAENSALLNLARSHDLRVLPTIMNNFDGPRIAALLAGDKTRAAHIRAIVDLVERMNYDGIDLDYEALPAEARDDLSAFIEALAAELHARGKLLSMAIHPKTDDNGTWHGPRAQDWPRLGAAVDEFKVMVYDYHWSTSPPGPIAPLDWIDEVLIYAEQCLPPAKVWLGLPFYGYDWSDQKGKGLVWATAQELIKEHQPLTDRDPLSGELNFSYTEGGTRHTVYIPDARAIAAKMHLAQERHPHIAGIALWRLGGESAAHWASIRRER